MYNRNRNDVLMKFIIPKGTKYYTNPESGEYVSEQIQSTNEIYVSVVYDNIVSIIDVVLGKDDIDVWKKIRSKVGISKTMLL